jgi:hypothetical protein
MAFTVDSKLGDLLKDKRVSEIVDKILPGATTHPMIAIGKTLTIKTILTLPQAKQIGFTKEVVDRILAEANALPPL